MYCEAYFLGAIVQVVRPGDTLTDTSLTGVKKTKKVPKDFVKQHEIHIAKGDYGPIMNAGSINSALKEYKMSDTFCILGVTNVDIYHGVV